MARVRAAVLPAVGAPLEITDIDLPATGPGQVRVRLAAAGVCHSDLSLSNGTMRVPVPAVLGHEGAGTVVSVGEGVTHIAPGDPVVLNWAPSCGVCHHCGIGEVWLCADALSGAGNVYARTAGGTDLHPGLNVAAFAEETVVAANCVLPVPDGIPLTDAALLGCAILTGYGAVHHSARVRAGESVAVFGVGGVGLAVLQSARIAGAGQIVAVDVSPEKEELARAAGATDFVIASETTAREIRKLTGGQGADVAIECVGRAVTIRTAWDSTRRGGRTTVVGIGGKDQQVT
ncbi:alcohol dehydrogenase catalytic domain-containing protein, partial [Streptomyces chryseus]